MLPVGSPNLKPAARRSQESVFGSTEQGREGRGAPGVWGGEVRAERPAQPVPSATQCPSFSFNEDTLTPQTGEGPIGTPLSADASSAGHLSGTSVTVETTCGDLYLKQEEEVRKSRNTNYTVVTSPASQ